MPDGVINDRWIGVAPFFESLRAEATDDYLTGEGVAALYREVTAGGGNLLLNVGPRADGSIPENQAQALGDFGRSLA